MFQSNFVYFNVDGMNPPALAQQAYVNRETIDTLLNCIEQSRGKTPEPGQHVLSVWFSTIASGRYNSELDDEMYDKSFIDDYGYIDRYTLSELGIEYSSLLMMQLTAGFFSCSATCTAVLRMHKHYNGLRNSNK